MEQEYCAVNPWTWRDRLRFKLFPSQHCPLPDAPAHYADCVVIKTVAVFPWLDRLRILWSGRCVVQTRTVTENIVGACVTAGVAYPALRETRLR